MPSVLTDENQHFDKNVMHCDSIHKAKYEGKPAVTSRLKALALFLIENSYSRWHHAYGLKKLHLNKTIQYRKKRGSKKNTAKYVCVNLNSASNAQTVHSEPDSEQSKCEGFTNLNICAGCVKDCMTARKFKAAKILEKKTSKESRAAKGATKAT